MTPGVRPPRALLLLGLLGLALLVAALLPAPVGAREIIVEDVSNPGRDNEVVPTVGDSGDRDDQDEEEGGDDEQPEWRRQRRQTREIIVEDVSNPGKDNEVVPTVGDSGDRDDQDEEEGEQPEWRRRQMREIIVEDVSNPGRDNEVVPTVGDSGDRDDQDEEEEGQEEMQEEVGWNPFGYRRLQDLPGAVIPAEVLANWTNPPNADDPDAWKQDMKEIMALLEAAVEREEAASIEARVGADGQVEETGLFANFMNAISKSPDKLFPMCSPVGVVSRMHLICPITVISARMLIRGPPDFEHLADEHHLPNNHGGRLPEPLEELSDKEDGTPVPFIIDKAIVERERPTYAWYARHVFNMYAYTFKYADELVLDLKDQTTPDRAHLLRPIIPAGWGEQNLYFIRYPSGVMMPIGQSIIKGDLMVVIFRGTMFPGGWVTDYQFPWADKKATEAMGIPGRVHRGFFNFASQFFKEFENEVDLAGIKRITFTGHSLGGAIAQVSAAFMTKNHNHLKINCVTFGSPQVGDAEFTDYLNRKVNLRRVAYLGSGQLDIPEEKHLVYGFGDIITQMPVACSGLSMPACSGLDFAKDTEGLGSFTYAMGHGNIPIYAHDLKNTEGWLRKENFVFGAREFKNIPEGVMASHICSYQCWTSMVSGDPDDRCFFPEDEKAGKPGVDHRYICSVDFSDTLPKRWPILKQPPSEEDMIHANNIADEAMGNSRRRKLRSSSKAAM